MVYGNTENQLILLVGNQRHSFQKCVQTKADHDPQWECVGRGVVDVAMFDPLGKLLQQQLK